ncbi:MAG: MATE family efflux transporter [Muribaculaceae bacterium]|nr:MATE family efflux transporter [Muribaculaceae bacterium]
MLKRCIGLLALALPVMVSQISLIVVSFADNIMVGRYSTEALAASSFCVNIFNVINICGMGFSYGLTPIIGRLFARHDMKGIGLTMRAGLIANVAVGVLLSIIMGILYFHLELLNPPAELFPLIRPYYLLSLVSILFLSVFNAFAQWSYAIKNTAMPMCILLACNAINIIGNYLLIYGNYGAPEMGLTGAGISTLFVRILAAAAIAVIFFRKKSNNEFRNGFLDKSLPMTGGLMGKVVKTSWPVALQMTFECAAFSGCAVFVGWMGKVPLAAYQIIVVVGQLGFCIYYSIGMAIAVLVANEAGKGVLRQCRRVAFDGYAVMLLFAAFAIVVFISFSSQLMGFFTADKAVLDAARCLIVPLAIYQLGDATQVTFANALRGTSHVMSMMWIAFVSYVVVGLTSSWIIAFPCGLGLYGIVLSFSISLFMAAGLFLRQFLKTTAG